MKEPNVLPAIHLEKENSCSWRSSYPAFCSIETSLHWRIFLQYIAEWFVTYQRERLEFQQIQRVRVCDYHGAPE